MLLIHLSLPAHEKSPEPERVDVIGGLLLALAPRSGGGGASTTRAPTASRCCSSYGVPLVIGAVVAGRVRVGTLRPHPVDRTARRAIGPFLASLARRCAPAPP